MAKERKEMTVREAIEILQRAPANAVLMLVDGPSGDDWADVGGIDTIEIGQENPELSPGCVYLHPAN